MKIRRTILIRGLAVAALTGAAALAVAQNISDIGRAASFSMDLYHRAPDNEKIRARLSGAETLPLDGGLLEVKQFKLEEFGKTGVKRLTAQAPACTFDQFGHLAHSSGHIQFQTADGKLRVDADGYSITYHNSENMTLMLSNRVHTVIDSTVLETKKP